MRALWRARGDCREGHTGSSAALWWLSSLAVLAGGAACGESTGLPAPAEVASPHQGGPGGSTARVASTGAMAEPGGDDIVEGSHTAPGAPGSPADGNGGDSSSPERVGADAIHGGAGQGAGEDACGGSVPTAASARIAPPEPSFEPPWGERIAVSERGDRIAVAVLRTCYQTEYTDLREGCAQPAAYVLQERDGEWVVDGMLTPSTAVPLAGVSVSISGDGERVAVGTSSRNCPNGTVFDPPPPCVGAGGAFVFRRGPDGWQEEAHLEPNPLPNRSSAAAVVALDGDGATLAVGMPWASAILLFERSGQTWVEQGLVTGAASFGAAVALSRDGATLAATAPGESSCARGVNGNPFDPVCGTIGAAYVFSRQQGAWRQEALIKSEFERYPPGQAFPLRNGLVGSSGARSTFGQTIALSGAGNMVAVSEFRSCHPWPSEDTCHPLEAVYLAWRSPEGTWQTHSTVQHDGDDGMAEFGSGLHLSDDAGRLSVGASGEPPDPTCCPGCSAGLVHNFLWQQDRWTPDGRIHAPDGGGDAFGATVIGSGDGSTLVIGGCRTGSSADPRSDSCSRTGGLYARVP